jgi:hypothetical protein
MACRLPAIGLPPSPPLLSNVAIQPLIRTGRGSDTSVLPRCGEMYRPEMR